MAETANSAWTNPAPIIDNIVDRLRHVASANNEASLCHPSLLTGAADEIEALRTLVVQAHRDSWSDEGEQMWACRGLLSLSDEQTQVLLRALDSGSGQADDEDCRACCGTGCRLGPNGCNGRQHAFIGCSTCIACRGSGLAGNGSEAQS